MIKDFWDSFKDNIKERVTNPFLGTFVLVWIVYNWKVVYAFFFFDKEYNLEQKLNFFTNYWAGKSFAWNIISVATITVGILGITYIFLAFSRYVGNLYENIVLPIIVKLSKGKTVTYETHQKALEKISSLEKRVEEERKAKNEAINERESLEQRLYPAKKEVPNENSKKRISEIEEYEYEEYKDVIKQLKNSFKDPSIQYTFSNIAKEATFSSSDENMIDFLLNHGIVELTESNIAGRVYRFTRKGLEFRRQYFENLK